ncbi:hypothetical protein AVEN_8125-1 [Araneus ventricosus]|uniref:Uncharacterized protein n=1 Tax=Araneus ventricosus TaxID=182803 RepID=A0A4Y2PCI7_ARAVE|nr:hypothetical protein AVEN_8125-1 [Araneus ventricosus]
MRNLLKGQQFSSSEEVHRRSHWRKWQKETCNQHLYFSMNEKMQLEEVTKGNLQSAFTFLYERKNATGGGDKRRLANSIYISVLRQKCIAAQGCQGSNRGVVYPKDTICKLALCT